MICVTIAAVCLLLAVPAGATATDLWILRAPVADRTEGGAIGPIWGSGVPVYERINDSQSRNQIFTDALASTTDGGIETTSGQSYYDAGDGFAEWVLNVHNPTGTNSVTVNVRLYEPDGTQVDGNTTYVTLNGTPNDVINESHTYWTTAGSDPRFSFTIDSEETISLWTGNIFNSGTPDETVGDDGEWFRPTIRVQSTQAGIQAHLQGYQKHRNREKAGTTAAVLSDKVMIERVSVAGLDATTSVSGTEDMRLTLPWFRELNRLHWSSNTSAPSYNSMISVVNTEGTSNTIWIYVFNKDGTQTNISPSNYSKQLSANERFMFSPSQFFTNGSATNPKLEGFVKIIGDENIVAESRDVQIEQQPALSGEESYWWADWHITPLLEEVIDE